MKITPVGGNGFQLTRLGLFNAYLVRESDGFTLIDTTLKGAGDELIKAAASVASGGFVIRRILLTHAHGDHVGSTDELMAKLGADTQLAIGYRDARLLNQPPDKSVEPGEPQREPKGSFPGIVSKPTHLVAAGELFGSLRVLATPGHTPGHMAYLDERDGSLYAGDSLVAVGGKPHVPGFGPWYFPLPAMATWDKAMARRSVEALRDLPIQRVAAGHGRLLEGRGLIAQALGDAR